VFVVNSRPLYPLNVIAGDAPYPDPDWIREVIGKASGELFWLDATSHAVKLGGPIMLNMIMLGAGCALPRVPVEMDDIKTVLRDVFPEAKLEPNFKALELGGKMILDYDR
jgi:indolepyruvate ferredoxin oxidoreductase beta subunit